MSCMVSPAKRVWRGIRARLGLRRTTTTGLGRLRKEVRTCEYGDVHVMWEMLSKPTTSTSSGKGVAVKRRTWRKVSTVTWSRLASYCCAL